MSERSWVALTRSEMRRRRILFRDLEGLVARTAVPIANRMGQSFDRGESVRVLIQARGLLSIADVCGAEQKPERYIRSITLGALLFDESDLLAITSSK